MKLKKREWIYVQPPMAYEVNCNLCGNKRVEWSEFEGHVWCWRCLKDVRGTGGVFDGPVPIQGMELIGICFDRVCLKTGQWLKPRVEGDRVIYEPIASLYPPIFDAKPYRVEDYEK